MEFSGALNQPKFGLQAMWQPSQLNFVAFGTIEWEGNLGGGQLPVLGCYDMVVYVSEFDNILIR